MDLSVVYWVSKVRGGAFSGTGARGLWLSVGLEQIFVLKVKANIFAFKVS